MKKVLFIAYLYPPIVNSGTRRSLEFVNHLPDCGWKPIVLTVQGPPVRECDNSLLEEVRPGTQIERVPFLSTWIANKIAGFFKYFINPLRLSESLDWRLKRIWEVPDMCAMWFPLAVQRSIAIFRNEGFDAIYATGWPWTSFLIATAVSRKTGVPFVIDYRDFWRPAGVEWDKPTRLQHWFNPWLESFVIKRAKYVVSVTNSFVKEISAATGRATNIVCITNGFDPEDFPPRIKENVCAATGDFVHIVYTGVWREGYGPDDLFRAIKYLMEKKTAVLKNLRVTVAGFTPGRAKDYAVDSYIQELGVIPHAKAIELMATASVLYLPVSKGLYEKTSLPGKLFEYLGSGNLILASALPGSEVAMTLDDVGGGLCIPPGAIHELADTIEALCTGKVANLFPPRTTEKVENYTRAKLTKYLAEVLDKTVGFS